MLIAKGTTCGFLTYGVKLWCNGCVFPWCNG